MIEIVRFKNWGGLRRSIRRGSPDFWIEKGDIALQVGPVVRMCDTLPGSWDDGEKDVIPLVMGDGTLAYAVCAPNGWYPWIDTL